MDILFQYILQLNFVLFLLVVIALGIHWHLKRHYAVFEYLGIPGPKPSLLCGNLPEILQRGQLQAIQEWRKQYGRVFGYFEGYTPVLSVADPEIVKEVLVKDFQNFTHRKPFPLAPRKSLGLFLENGGQWKRSRALLTPAFSSGKLKQMFNTMSTGVDHLLVNLDKTNEDQPIDIYNLFQSLTLDIIGRCAFGLQTNAQTDRNDPFLTNIRTLFRTLSTTFILPLVMVLPFVQHFIFAIKNVVLLFGMNPVVWLRNQMREVINIRKSMGSSTQSVDLVHQMLFSDKRTGEPMTEREIVAQSMTFLLAGYETTSAVLAYLIHLLAHHQTVQSRLSDEMEQIGKEEINYDTFSDMPYFNMVFDEVCRLYPTASMIVTRKAATDCIYNKVKIPAGMNVQVDVWGLHHDSDLWDDPHTFQPERFSMVNKSNIKSFSFLPFGAGPRNCIGARFAMLETKIAIMKILQKYRFEPLEKGQEELELVCRGAIVPKNGVHVRVIRKS